MSENSLTQLRLLSQPFFLDINGDMKTDFIFYGTSDLYKEPSILVALSDSPDFQTYTI